MRQMAYVLTTLCLVLGALPPVVAADIGAVDLQRAMHSSQRAHAALRTGNITKAQRLFVLALKAVPELPEAHLGLGQVWMQQRNFGEALTEFERAKSGYGLIGDALLSIQWDRHRESQRRAESLRSEALTLQRAADREIRDAVKSRLIAAAERQEQMAEQLEDSRPPTASDSAVPPGEVYFHMGNALLNLGRLQEAVEAWETCAKREPAFPLVHHNLAVGYWKLNRLDAALESMEQAEALGFEVNPQFKADLKRGLQAIRPGALTD